ncbi:hypothetical protein CROQUDRAFT_51247 [Cronartium quercuum f. sp. fusiforme G11]|uniref:Conserved oligomeric Golgi complex subunit 4 n=1 Tax=Cronartium quercuum f. sp. fusiforme G11 TaxID=708437 RepID=A0A9P6T7R5_9BASI|nr:hypothetical protein CROQUDRAFT_51247 [Cronartium quercuum f. sp. fusiforme G11]
MYAPYTRQHLATLVSHRELIDALTNLESTEYKLDSSLAKTLGSPDTLEKSLSNIDQLRPRLSSLANDASTLHEVVTERAAIAQRISSKVRLLDLEQNRLKECIDRVQAIAELKDSFKNLLRAIENADWEAATRHIQRARAIKPEILGSQFAEAVVPSADLPEPPTIALENLTNQLTTTFLNAFSNAASSKDEATTTRFFKLFPLLGPHSSEAGLAAYSDFVRTLITLPTYPRSGPKPCLPQLTSLFEQLALIIDQHQPIVDKYYGPRSMLTVVIRLNLELDRHTTRILSTWDEDRQPDRKLSEVSGYGFPILTQLLSVTSNGSLNSTGPISAINSPAGLHSSLRSFAGNVQRTYNLQPSLSASSQAQTTVQESDAPDVQAIDGVIAELAGMSSRWQTYRRFLYARFGDDSDEPDEKMSPNHVQPPASNEHLKPIESTDFSRSIADLLLRLYIPLELAYLRMNIEKAHTTDEFELDSTPYLSSALDDTFFVLKKAVYRSLSIANTHILEIILKEIAEIVVRDFGEVIKHRLDSVGVGISGVGFGIGSKVGEGKEKREKNAMNAYIVYLNDLDMASEYMVKLVEEVIGGDTLTHSFFQPSEFDEAITFLSGLKASHTRFASFTKTGLEQLFNQLIRPRLRPMITECYKDVTYFLDEERYAETEAQDIFRKRFVRVWESLIEPYQTALTSSNFHQLFALTINTLSRPWETQIRNMKFTELGAIRFDRDLRSISSYLTSQTSFAISIVNEAFARLRQIALLLGLDEEEENLKDFLVGEEVTWRLSMAEIRAVLGQKKST